MKPKIPRKDRICKYCKDKQDLSVIGDEMHFLLKCPKFDKERNDLLEKSYHGYPNVLSLSPIDLFTYLMSSENDIIISVAKFCFTNLPKKSV